MKVILLTTDKEYYGRTIWSDRMPPPPYLDGKRLDELRIEIVIKSPGDIKKLIAELDDFKDFLETAKPCLV